MLPEILVEMSMQVVILEHGKDWLEEKFQHIARTYPLKAGVQMSYDCELVNMIYARIDFFIMPSRFEPRGLSQLYAIIYGATFNCMCNWGGS